MQTQTPKAQSKTPILNKEDEKILVVQRTALFGEQAPQGLVHVDVDAYAKKIAQNSEFIWRSKAEVDPTFKQIIPYLVFKHEDEYFLMRRKKTAGEQRLADKYTLGIGGHIRQDDIDGTDLVSWAKREFEEEVAFDGTVKYTPIGLINDESNLVGQVHTGFVFLLEGSSSNISVKDELASGTLVTLDECVSLYIHMETWSQIIFDYLVALQSK